MKRAWERGERNSLSKHRAIFLILAKSVYGMKKMRAVDKFGNKINNKTYKQMIEYGLLLKEQGYIESKKKPNLFYKKIDEGIIFADMRGTDIIPIWEDTSPLLYCNFGDDIPLWKQRRILNEEKSKCKGRFSFYMDSEPDGLMFNDEEDGFCKGCSKDFQDNGLFCSKKCEEEYEKKELAKTINRAEICEICGRKIPKLFNMEKAEKLLNIKLPKIEIGHHLNYKEDKRMIVCASCHAKIHHSKDPKYEKYRPKDKRLKPKTQYKLIPCGLCDGKVRIPYDADENKFYLCYRCRKKEEREPFPYISKEQKKYTEEYWEYTRKGS